MEVSFCLNRQEEGKQTGLNAHVRYSGLKFKHCLTEKIDPVFWNPQEQRAKRTNRFPGYMEFNRRLGKIQDKIKDLYSAYRNNNGREPTPAEFRSIIDRELKGQLHLEQKTFVSFFEDIKEASSNGSRVQHKTGKPFNNSTINGYLTAINHLKVYEQNRKRKLDFDDITVEFHADYTEFLIRRYQLGANSIGKDIKIIKMIMAEATERGLHKNFQFKSKRFSVTKEPITSINLTQKEIDELQQSDLSTFPRLEKVRDLFIVGCHTGLRFSDLSILRPAHIQDGFIKITQVKTDNEVVIPVHPVVLTIMEKYNGRLPKAISNQKTNEYLKEIGQRSPLLSTDVSRTFTKGGMKVIEHSKKWELLSTHTARRTFATLEYLAGTSTETIMAITGHRNAAAFKAYLRLTPTEHAQKMKDLWATRNQLKPSKI